MLLLTLNFTTIFVIYTRDTSFQHYFRLRSKNFIHKKTWSILKNSPKIDWVNYSMMAEDAKRLGPGEHGSPVRLNDKAERIKANHSIYEYSFNAVASSKISLDRSIPDTRHEHCKTRKYYADLPPTSVIILFHDEHPSVLLRTVHSVVNRTPKQLLKEVILVDDNSSKTNLFQELDDHISQHFPDVVKILRLKQRHGLMRARMAGILQAKADIIVVMDGHIEVNVNWLPPLIEPIAEDYRTATEPMVNYIDWNTIWYNDFVHTGHRGGFSWALGYTMLDRKLAEGEDVADNFNQPVLLGAIMAFNKHFFFELGGFDKKLKIWGGEQYDLSFKYWRCGGRILGVPCSTVGHNYKGGGHHPYAYNTSYVFHNLAR